MTVSTLGTFHNCQHLPILAEHTMVGGSRGRSQGGGVRGRGQGGGVKGRGQGGGVKAHVLI